MKLSSPHKEQYEEQIKQLCTLYPDEMVTILDHFATSDLYPGYTDYLVVVVLNRSDIGRNLHKLKGEARNEAFLHFVSMWDTLHCWAKQDRDAVEERRKLDPDAPEDNTKNTVSSLIAKVVYQLIVKLFGTRLLHYGDVIRNPERGYDFAKKLRFNAEQLTRFVNLVFEITDHTHRKKRGWLNEPEVTDIFVSLLRLLECQSPTLLQQETHKIRQIHSVLEAIKTDGFESNRKALTAYQNILADVLARCEE